MSDALLLHNDKARIVDTSSMDWADPLTQEPLHGAPTTTEGRPAPALRDVPGRVPR